MTRLVVRTLLVASMLLAAAPALAHASYPGANGKILYYTYNPSLQDYDLWTVNADGTGATNVTSTPDTDEYAGAWSPDGTKIVFVRRPATGVGRIYVVNADGTGLVDITPDLSAFNGTAHPQDVAWSPDGSTIAFTNAAYCGYAGAHLMLIDTDGSNPRRVTCGWDPPPGKAAGGYGVSWRPDGLKLALQGPTGYSQDRIYTVNPDGTEFLQLAPHDFGEELPDWSPDGARVAYFDGQITAIGADGTGVLHLASGGHPVWAPDNTRIAFDAGDIRTVKPDGTGEASLASPPVIGHPVDWLAIPQNAYPRPKGATPTRASLVVSNNPCTAPDRIHGPPLAFGSCSSPQRTSAQLTVGTGDSNGLPALNEGYLVLKTLVGAPGGADDTDVALDFFMDDVFTNALADYSGELRAHVSLQITDKLNTPNPGGPGAATTQQVPLDLVVSCTPTAATNEGSACTSTTSIDALVPGAVPEGRRAIWQLGRVEVYDGGPDSDADTPAGDTLFATQGIFIP